MSPQPTRLPYDPELRTVLDRMTFTPSIEPNDIPRVRKMTFPVARQVLTGQDIEHEERIITGPEGDLMVSIFGPSGVATAPAGNAAMCPGIYFIHGGGMFTGSRFLGVQMALDWVARLGVKCVSIEYRLPPEHPHPAPVEDCYAGLLWMSNQATELGIDPNNICIAGISAGGGIAAGTALLARDRGGPALRAQVLECPMLDDRNDTFSARQFASGGTWSQGSNTMGWTCLLGEQSCGDDVSIYAAPSRATGLSGLPPAFISVGSAEIFRDEALAYASRLWQSGVQAELHVWAGGFHGFSELAPNAAVSVASCEARRAWVRRTLCVDSL